MILMWVVAVFFFILAFLPRPKSFAERAGESLKDWIEKQIAGKP